MKFHVISQQEIGNMQKNQLYFNKSFIFKKKNTTMVFVPNSSGSIGYKL